MTLKSSRKTNHPLSMEKLIRGTKQKYEGYHLLNDGLLTYKGRLYIPNCDDLKRFIMDELHKMPYTGHHGYQKMITSTRKLFYWPEIEKYIVDYLSKCL
jgi:hypothetical protein